MAHVRILPPEIVSKIAAGEVIERPASVLKELLENSLDANASEIEVLVQNAGKTLIQIRDSGTGIAEEDLKSVFNRHATSKISRIEDLYAIDSLGFRGEALYSIAAVADVTLSSRTGGQDSGWIAHVRGSERLSHKPTAMRVGTNIEVKELFFNTPARKKFLKSNTTEFNRLIDLFIPYTLLYPVIRFTLTHDERTVVELAATNDLKTRIAGALHVDQNDLILDEKDFGGKNLSIRLALGDINIQRSRKDMQFIFVNNRPVENKTVSFHMNDIYRGLLSPGIYPLFCVFITMPAEELDVNVHPTKREVKIKDETGLSAVLRQFCEPLLMTRSKPPQSQTLFTAPDRFERRSLQRPDIPSEQLNMALAENIALYKTDATQTAQNDLRSKLKQSRYLGNLLKTFLLFETADSLLVIDQHAAQERISFEKLRLQLESSKIEVQKLLVPITIKASSQELLAREEAQGVLEKMGFETTLFDKETIAIHSHPQLITDPQNSLRNLLAGEQISRMNPEKLARLACRSSVMAGFAMNKEQAEYQRSALLQAHDPFTCPHGRPTVIEISEAALRKQFLR
ncbi:MAG TPA: DNA mismatch repair endonuclease MutL [Candidatus Omnitrophota bacterium]|mgnify:CR=1 FL=1|nr:DNA mismatch repair endonuclease MutL [Candidatus Omnitrophota bacterium]HQQ05362.1 DNA mismatch repair endonuclease MutL [Candidatus Omnitrophota bacterium]